MDERNPLHYGPQAGRAAGPAFEQVREAAQTMVAEGRGEEALEFLLAALAAVLTKSRELSPLLSNVLLDELDKELERRGHRFVRYADDFQVFVKSKAAGERVMTSLEGFLTKRLRLKVNLEKSAVGRPWGRKLLGYRPPRTGSQS